MKRLSCPEYSTNDFCYNPLTRIFVAEYTTLSRGGRRRVFGALYLGIWGFRLLSAETGFRVTYAVEMTDLDSDGDIAGWWLIPAPGATYLVPACGGTRVLVIND
jgi:hypothetical protein